MKLSGNTALGESEVVPRQSRRIETKILREGASQRVVREVCREEHREEEREKRWRQREKREKQNERQKQRE